MGCSEQLLRAGGCFLSTSCVPAAAPPTCRGLRGPGGADRERAPPNRRICSFRLPRAPWPSRQRQSGPAAGPRGQLLLSREDLATSWGYQPSPRDSTACPRSPRVCVLGGRQDQGHGPGTHGPQGAQPGPTSARFVDRRQAGRGGVLPHLRLTATLPTSASVEAPPHPGGQRGRQALTLAQPGCPHWQTPPRRALQLWEGV